MDKGKIS
jgi:hypothetical protein